MVTDRGLLRRDADFRWFWAGHTVSAFGTQISAVALPLVAVVTLDAGAGVVAAVSTAAYLPNVLLPLVAGHWLESRRRRRVMVAADLVRAALLAVVPAAFALGMLSAGLLVAVAFLVGAASVVFDTGSFAYVPSIVAEEDLPAANRAAQGSRTAAEVAGPGVAGWLVGVVGPAAAVLADALSYLAGAAGVARARRPEPAPPAPEPGARFFAGLRPLATNPYLRALTGHAMLYNAAWQVLSINLVIYAVDDRGLSPAQFGLALSASGAGAFLGTMLALRAADRFGYGHAFAGALVLSTGVPLAIVFLPGSATAVAIGLAGCQFAAGTGLGVANVLSLTLRQTVAPQNSLARTGAGYRLFIYGVLPVGSVLGGVLGEALGSRAAVLAGATALACSIVPMLGRRIRRLRTPAQARPPAAPVSAGAERAVP